MENVKEEDFKWIKVYYSLDTEGTYITSEWVKVPLDATYHDAYLIATQEENGPSSQTDHHKI